MHCLKASVMVISVLLFSVSQQALAGSVKSWYEIKLVDGDYPGSDDMQASFNTLRDTDWRCHMINMKPANGEPILGDTTKYIKIYPLGTYVTLKKNTTYTLSNYGVPAKVTLKCENITSN